MRFLIGPNQNPKDVNTEVRMIVMFHRRRQPSSWWLIAFPPAKYIPTSHLFYWIQFLVPFAQGPWFHYFHQVQLQQNLGYNRLCLILGVQLHMTVKWKEKKVKPERKKMSFQHRIVGHTFWRCYNYLGSKLERKRCKDET